MKVRYMRMEGIVPVEPILENDPRFEDAPYARVWCTEDGKLLGEMELPFKEPMPPVPYTPWLLDGIRPYSHLAT